MPGVTPIFRWPFQSLPDPPDGPNLGEDLAMAIEATMQSTQTRVAQNEASISALQAGQAGAFVKLAETVLTVAANDITFSTISQSYRHLQLHGVVRGSAAATFDGGQMQFNADTSAIYDSQQMTGNAATIAAFESLNQTSATIGECTANTAPAGAASNYVINIPYYSATTFWKTALIEHHLSIGTASGNLYRKAWSGRWRNTAAITSIKIFPATNQWMIGSSFSLYGIL